MNKINIVVSDTGAILSLSAINQILLLEKIFGNIYIPTAVWNELNMIKDFPGLEKVLQFFKGKVCNIKRVNNLNLFMDYGESESLILYEELSADYLLIDDKKARAIAESLGIKCIGTLGLLLKAKDLRYIDELYPLFVTFLKCKRFYAINLLKEILRKSGEIESIDKLHI